MKQLGNLAVVCAQRPELLLLLNGGVVTVCVGAGPERRALAARWNDDAEIAKIITKLNFGEYAVNRTTCPEMEAAA
ncbi:MAG: hypothetical protein IKS55_12255 [Oscillospiraceae bacterium]|nr:hypothetical protein [Oscillospiraceae bacterium]